MDRFLARFLDKASDFLAHRPGLLPLIGVVFIFINFLLQIVPGPGTWLVDSNLVLHLGLIISILGLLLIRALG